MSINHVCVSGNLTRDPELRTTQSGTPVLSFDIAVNERVKRGSEWEDYANFFSCTWFGSRAQSVAQYISKGSHVTISGKLRYRSWERDGQKRSKVEILVDDIDFTGGKGGNKTESQAPRDYESVYDEDIPF